MPKILTFKQQNWKLKKFNKKKFTSTIGLQQEIWMHMVVPHVVCNFVSFQTKKCALCAYNFIEEIWQSFENPNLKGLKTLWEIRSSSTTKIFNLTISHKSSKVQTKSLKNLAFEILGHNSIMLCAPTTSYNKFELGACYHVCLQPPTTNPM
jgi:hypothetical protein